MKLRSREREASTQSREREQGVAPSKASRYGNAYMQEQLSASGVPSGAVAHTGGKSQVPSERGGARPTVEDGTVEQTEAIEAALGAARRMVAQGLALVQVGAASERERALLEGHLHTSDPTLLVRATSVLSKVQAGLGGSVPIEVEGTQIPFGDRTTGYVYGGPFAKYSDIHLLPRFFERGEEEQGGTLVHEASHKYAGTRDHAYFGKDSYDELTSDQALENADSYAMLCQRRERDIRADEEQRKELAAADAARTHAEAVWAAFEAGTLRFGLEGFITDEGVEIPIGLVKGIILERFADRHADRRAEIVQRIGGTGRFDAIRCADGYLASAELVHSIADEEGL